MANPSTVQHQGALLSSGIPGGLQLVMDTNFRAAYSASKEACPTLTSVLVGAPLTLPLEGITKVRLLAAKATGGQITLMLTSTGAADQLVKLGTDGLFLHHNPSPGDELTAIKAYGTGNLSYFIAGD